MNTFIIEVNSSVSGTVNGHDLHISLGMSEYLDIFKLIKNLGLLGDLQESAASECRVCKSFAVSTPVLFHLIEKIIRYMDSGEFSQSFDSWAGVYDSLLDIRDSLMEIAYMTDKEWNEYYASGRRDRKFIYEYNGELLTDSEGNHFKYVSDKVVFQFDDQCECSALTE